MNRILKVTAVVMTMALLISASMAQGGGAGQGRGQGRGGFGQGMGGRGGANLLSREDVQKELALTDGQKSKIKAIMDKASEDRRAMMEEMRNGGGDREAMTKQMADAQAKVKKETDAVLNDDQKKRLQEIEIQVQGTRALLNADVQKALGITDAQKKSLEAAQQKQMDRMREMMEEMRNSGGGGGGEEMRTAMQENQKKSEAEMLAVLTGEQKTKFESMKGKKFEGAAQAGGQFGGGAGRGGNRGGTTGGGL